MKKLIPLFLYFVCHPVLADIIGYDSLKGFAFGAIRSVEFCKGPFIGKELGEHRLIRAYIYGSDMIFIDNVLMTKHGLEVAKGFSFFELNDDHAEYSIERASCTSNGKRLEIDGYVNASGHDEETKFEFRILLNPKNGQYEFQKLKQNVVIENLQN